MTGTDAPPPFRLAYVPGATPAKWARIWSERQPGVPLELVAVPVDAAAAALRDGDADAALLRLPVDRTDLSAIPLYTETSVLVVPKDHEATAAEELSVGDLAGYVLQHPLDDSLEWEALPGTAAFERPATTADAIELVAAGVGLLVVPQSLARLHHRRDLTYRPLTDAPQSRIALAWPEAKTTDLVEEFIGIVRGRTVNSSRGRGAAPAAKGGASGSGSASGSRTGSAAGGSAASAKGRPGTSGGAARGRGAASGGKTGGASRSGKPRRRG